MAKFKYKDENGDWIEVANKADIPTQPSDIGAQPEGDYVIDPNYVHTDNNFTDADKAEVAKVVLKANQSTEEVIDPNTGESAIADVHLAAYADVSNAAYYADDSFTATNAINDANGNQIDLTYATNTTVATKEPANANIQNAVKKVTTLTVDGGQLTGFVNPIAVDVSYNGATRKITLTGNVDARWQGIPMTELVPSFVSGWVSEAHDIADGEYFLSFNGTSFVWSTVAFDFKQLQIAFVYRDGINVCLRECHGLQDWQSHEANHNNVGTVLRSGADVAGFTLNSDVVANRRPTVSQALVYDEDLPSNLLALTNGLYTRLFLDGANNANFETDKTDIIEYTAGNRFLYNLFTGGVWTKATAANNQYAKIFLMAIPTTSDLDCQKSRFVWIMPQTVNATLLTIQALAPSSVNLGQISTALAEYVFVQEVIIRATASGWTIISTAKLTGNKRFQSVTSGNFLSSVAVNSSISGDGTVSNPLATTSSLIPFTPSGNISATNVDGALKELDNKKVDKINGKSLIADTEITKLEAYPTFGSTQNKFLKYNLTQGISTISENGTVTPITTTTSQPQYYVATTGNDSTGDGTVINPWATVSKAISEVASGCINIAEGTYLISSTLYIPTNISLQGVGPTTILKTTMPSGYIIGLFSNDENTLGNQEIRYIKFDGNNKIGGEGIKVVSRSNVKIHHCDFINFVNMGVRIDGRDDLLQPILRAENNSVNNCTFSECGTSYPGFEYATGCIEFNGQKDFTCFNNTISELAAEGIKSVEGWNKGVKIYNNIVATSDNLSTWHFALEMWRSEGVEVYDNKFNGNINFDNCQALTLPYSVWIHNNEIYQNVRSINSINGISFDSFNSEVVIENNTVYNWNKGIFIYFVDGTAGFNNITIRNNLFYNIGDNGYNGSSIDIDTTEGAPNCEGFYLHNNTIHTLDELEISVRINVTSNFKHFYIFNNIFYGTSVDYSWNDSVGINIFGSGTMNYMQIYKNCIYGYFKNNIKEQILATNRVVEDNVPIKPEFDSLSTFILKDNSKLILSGVDLKIGYNIPKIGVDSQIEAPIFENIKITKSEPINVKSDELILFGKNIANRNILKTINSSGLSSSIQNSFWENNIVMWTPTTSTAGIWLGTAGASAGSFSMQLPITTNLYTTIKRNRYSNVVTTTNQVLGLRNTELMFFAGSNANQGGFFFTTRMGFDTWTNGGRFFAGMHTATTVVSGNPSSLNNSVGFCVDSADNGVISFLTRNSSSFTKVNTGFTITSNSGYQLFIFVEPGSSIYGWRIVEINTGIESSGIATLTTPVPNTMLSVGVLASNAALTSVNAINIAVNKIYVETYL